MTRLHFLPPDPLSKAKEALRTAEIGTKRKREQELKRAAVEALKAECGG